MTKQMDQLKQATLEAIEGFGGVDVISPDIIANVTVDKLDPGKVSPVLVRFGCLLEVKQIARGILRRSFDPIKTIDDPNFELFDGLQSRYPVERDGQRVYVKTHLIPVSEIRETIVPRLLRAGQALIKHSDTLLAYCDEREKLEMQSNVAGD